MTWDAADQYCSDIGGHLLRMEAEAEYQMIQNLILANESEGSDSKWINNHSRMCDWFKYLTVEFHCIEGMEEDLKPKVKESSVVL